MCFVHKGSYLASKFTLFETGGGYVLTYDLYTSKFFKAEWSAAVLKLSHEL